MGQRPAILHHAITLSELTRCRILRLLENRELTVSELCQVLQMPQSTVSRHLKVLLQDHWLESRKDGTSHCYQMKSETLEENTGRLWKLVQAEIEREPLAAQDRQRLDEVLAEKRARSRAFFRTTAGQWDRLRDELFGTRFDLLALAGLLDESWVVGDLACGTGRTAWALAPFVREVLAVDESQEMLDAAAHRLASLGNVTIRPGKLENLPLEDGSLDAAILSLALHHVPEPSLALGEIRRTLKPGGRLLLVDMMPHHREELRQEMGHVWLGFDDSQVESYLGIADFRKIRYRPLSTPSKSSGLGLFVATARAATDISKKTKTRLNPGG